MAAKLPLTVLHITDTHLHANRDATMRGLNTWESFSAVLEHVRQSRHRPDLVLATGDLVQDETRQGYELFRDMVAPLDVPVLCVPGNHDSPRIMAEVLSTAPFQTGGRAEFGHWQILLLDTSLPWEDDGQIGEEQLELLAQNLARQGDQPTLIAMHHHPLPMGSRWLDGLDVRDSATFLQLIEEHSNVRAVVWGHVHQASDRLWRHIRMLSTPSTGAQFLPGSDVFHMDDKSPGYRWLLLQADGTVETELVWLA